MTETVEIAPFWLEFHDLHVERTYWDEEFFVVEFSFGTVYNETITHYGYRIGNIRFEQATVSGAISTEEKDDDYPYLSSGSIRVGNATPAMIPIAGVQRLQPDIITRFVHPGMYDWHEVKIRSSSVHVIMTGPYKTSQNEWRRMT
jgi:hypothetical protein